MKWRITYFIAFAALLGHCVRSEADLVVTVNDATAAAGSSPLTLDVFVSSTGTDPLAVFNLNFTVSGPTGNMQFQSQPAGGSPFLGDPAYVFFGDSSANGDQGGSPSSFGTASPSSGPNAFLTFNGGDSTADFLDATVGTSPSLLAELVLSVPSFTTGAGNNTYSITLNPSTDPNNLNFMDSLGNTVPFDTTDSKLTGSITVEPNSSPPSVVPEPAAWQLALSGTLLCGLFVWRRRPRPGLQ